MIFNFFTIYENLSNLSQHILNFASQTQTFTYLRLVNDIENKSILNKLTCIEVKNYFKLPLLLLFKQV